jgi:hypothetical protein
MYFFRHRTSPNTRIVPQKTRKLDQVRKMQNRAVRFLRDVLNDPDKTDEFEAMSPEEYALHKRIRIENPRRPLKGD